MIRPISFKHYLLFVTIALFLLSCNNKNNHVIKCVTKWDCSREKCIVTQFWFYDKRGRLIEDSINEPDTLRASPRRTVYYSYKGDSIFLQGIYLSPLLVKLNHEGLPSLTAQLSNPWSTRDFYLPFYNPDGSLQKVTSKRDNGNETLQATIDSIIYSPEGNITSYHSTGLYGENLTVRCSYYTDKLCKEVFPTDKILALCVTPGCAHGMINVQPFSKNLVKSVEHDGILEEYRYKLNSDGQAIQITKCLNGNPKTATEYFFSYSRN